MLGKYMFRFNNPAEAARLREHRKVGEVGWMVGGLGWMVGEVGWMVGEVGWMVGGVGWMVGGVGVDGW